MQHSFKIEVLSPTKSDWSFYEALDETLDGIQSHVYCVRKAFPSFAVRAIDSATGQIVSMLKGQYADE
jgi:hypothetical protein